MTSELTRCVPVIRNGAAEMMGDGITVQETFYYRTDEVASRLASLEQQLAQANDAGLTMLAEADRLLALANDLEQQLAAANARVEAMRKPFDPVWLSMLYTAADYATPVHRGVIRRAYEALSQLPGAEGV